MLIWFVSNKRVFSQDDLSNDIEGLLEEIRIVQSRLSDLPTESLSTMEEGLQVTIIVNSEYSCPKSID